MKALTGGTARFAKNEANIQPSWLPDIASSRPGTPRQDGKDTMAGPDGCQYSRAVLSCEQMLSARYRAVIATPPVIHSRPFQIPLGAEMKVEQISIFLENRIGRLGEITNILAEAGINIRALSLADTSEFGILRLIVDKSDEAQAVLKQSGVTVGRTNVVAVEVSHSPGGLNAILHTLHAKGINVEYMYGFPFRQQEAIMIFRFDRPELAVEILQQSGVRIFSGEELCAV